MIAVGAEEQPLDTYARETLQRLPLADATLSLWAYVLQPTFLAQVFAEYRGRSFEETLTFARFVDLIGDALVEHEGSGRQSFSRAQEQGTLATSSEAVYGKLRRVPLSLSRGFFTEGTARLRALLPPQHVAAELPASLAAVTVVVGDGKTLKRVAKRLLHLTAGSFRRFLLRPNRRGGERKLCQYGWYCLTRHKATSGGIGVVASFRLQPLALGASPDREVGADGDERLSRESLRERRVRRCLGRGHVWWG